LAKKWRYSMPMKVKKLQMVLQRTRKSNIQWQFWRRDREEVDRNSEVCSGGRQCHGEVLTDDSDSEGSEDDEDDTAEVKALKVTFTCIYLRTRLR
jgi:hypothetical protein